jgi:hypothetical protein
MDRTRLTLALLAAALFACSTSAKRVGSSIYVPSPAVGVDLTAGGQVQSITGDGGAQLAVVPGNIQFANTATVNITESAPSSDVTTTPITMTAMPPFASATTNINPGGFLFNLGTQVDGNPTTSTSLLKVNGDSTNLFTFGGDPLLDTIPMFWFGQTSYTASTYTGF